MKPDLPANPQAHRMAQSVLPPQLLHCKKFDLISQPLFKYHFLGSGFPDSPWQNQLSAECSINIWSSLWLEHLSHYIVNVWCMFLPPHIYTFEPLEGTNFWFIFISSCHLESITKNYEVQRQRKHTSLIRELSQQLQCKIVLFKSIGRYY